MLIHARDHRYLMFVPQNAHDLIGHIFFYNHDVRLDLLNFSAQNFDQVLLLVNL